MKLFLFFIDGFGLGRSDPAVNPFLRAQMPNFENLLGGRVMVAESFPIEDPVAWGVATDTTLDVPGLPQSATGQTTILTGVNASKALGWHMNAHPTPTLKKILNEHSIFKRVAEAGLLPGFLNAYRPEFFNGDPKYRPSASTVAAMAAGMTFRSFDDLRAGQAVYHDIDHSFLAQKGYEMPPVDPALAGRRAGRLAAPFDFTMYEHFLTDFAGHTREMDPAIELLERLDRFLGGLLETLDLQETLLIVTSDHGNIEDLGVKTHTMNPVPTIAVGPGAREFISGIRSLTDIYPGMMRALGIGGGSANGGSGRAEAP
jgi:hypothetical protein